jgi:hypothetical protein
MQNKWLEKKKGGWAVYQTFKQVDGIGWCGGFCGGTLNDQTTEGCGIISLRGEVTMNSEQGLSIM